MTRRLLALSVAALSVALATAATTPSPLDSGSAATPAAASAPVRAGSPTTTSSPSSKRALPSGVAPASRTVHAAVAVAPAWVHPLPGSCRPSGGAGAFGAPRPLGATGSAIRYRHQGADLAKPTGTPILAVGGGVVTFAGWSGGAGNQVQYLIGGQILMKNNHLSQIWVRRGQWVNPGDGIGAVGMTGTASGPHLHIEVWAGGVLQNPVTWLRGVGVEIGC